MDDALCLIYLRKLRELVEKYQSEKAIHSHTHTHRRTYAELQSLTLTNTFAHTLESYTLNGSLSLRRRLVLLLLLLILLLLLLFLLTIYRKEEASANTASRMRRFWQSPVVGGGGGGGSFWPVMYDEHTHTHLCMYLYVLIKLQCLANRLQLFNTWCMHTYIHSYLCIWKPVIFMPWYSYWLLYL